MFTFELDTDDLFAERTTQFVDAWGIPAEVVARAHARIRDAWSDQPGGWTPEWAIEAEQAEAQRNWLLAALCWGAAKFPAIATPSHAEAYQRQLAAYDKAVSSFPVVFARHLLTVDSPVGPTTVAAHVFRRRRLPRRGTIFLCGGVDTWKVELHRPAVRIARATGFTVVALDNPGTGETAAPTGPGAEQILASTIEVIGTLVGGGPVGMIGVSFAGLWAAQLAIQGNVDAAITLGGPVGAELVDDLRALPNGMPGILAHALGLDHMPPPEDLRALQEALSLGSRGHLDRAPVSPVLAVNGEHDQFIPLADTTVFADLPGCQAWVVRDATHCAAEKINIIMPAALMWMVAQLTNRTSDRLKAAALEPLAARLLTNEYLPRLHR
ncbi:esterase FrsA [Nocardia sp. NBC_00881]|uniref:alpha/beta fold hydrolase n=1 Tax=Nocardia sp. NBC_00881 TaxID=2975995 RepID=UPI00386C35A2|nr:esterase FrsA [Nocardia sp. NBC_00881]